MSSPENSPEMSGNGGAPEEIEYLCTPIVPDPARVKVISAETLQAYFDGQNTEETLSDQEPNEEQDTPERTGQDMRVTVTGPAVEYPSSPWSYPDASDEPEEHDVTDSAEEMEYANSEPEWVSELRDLHENDRVVPKREGQHAKRGWAAKIAGSRVVQAFMERTEPTYIDEDEAAADEPYDESGDYTDTRLPAEHTVAIEDDATDPFNTYRDEEYWVEEAPYPGDETDVDEDADDPSRLERGAQAAEQLYPGAVNGAHAKPSSAFSRLKDSGKRSYGHFMHWATNRGPVVSLQERWDGVLDRVDDFRKGWSRRGYQGKHVTGKMQQQVVSAAQVQTVLNETFGGVKPVERKPVSVAEYPEAARAAIRERWRSIRERFEGDDEPAPRWGKLAPIGAAAALAVVAVTSGVQHEAPKQEAAITTVAPGAIRAFEANQAAELNKKAVPPKAAKAKVVDANQKTETRAFTVEQGDTPWSVLQRAGIPQAAIMSTLEQAAKQSGAEYQWHGSDQTRWLEVNGTSDTKKVMNTLDDYIK